MAIRFLLIKNKLPKIQLIIVFASIAYFACFFAIDTWFSAFYGGAISVVNTMFVNWHTNKQEKCVNISAQSSVRMMIFSVIMRMIVMLTLIFSGYFLLNLNVDALIISLVLGLIGFLFDKVLQK